MIETEQYYLNQYTEKFNISMYAGKTTGVEVSEEKRERISTALKNAGLKGRKKSEQTKLNMRKPKSAEHAENIKKAQEAVIKKVYQYSLDGHFINEHRSISDAGKIFSERERDRSAISATCCGRQKTARGFKWSFKKIQ